MNLRHGDSSSVLYRTWKDLKARCLNPRHKRYASYGGRGIRVYPAWLKYEPFRDYVLTHLGPRPEGMSLDRIDNDLGYVPGNLRWATDSIQQKNRRPGIAAGERNNHAKLTWVAVRMIRTSSGIPHQALAQRFGVSRSTIDSIIEGRTWLSVEQSPRRLARAKVLKAHRPQVEFRRGYTRMAQQSTQSVKVAA